MVSAYSWSQCQSNCNVIYFLYHRFLHNFFFLANPWVSLRRDECLCLIIQSNLSSSLSRGIHTRDELNIPLNIHTYAKRLYAFARGYTNAMEDTPRKRRSRRFVRQRSSRTRLARNRGSQFGGTWTKHALQMLTSNAISSLSNSCRHASHSRLVN